MGIYRVIYEVMEKKMETTIEVESAQSRGRDHSIPLISTATWKTPPSLTLALVFLVSA